MELRHCAPVAVFAAFVLMGCQREEKPSSVVQSPSDVRRAAVLRLVEQSDPYPPLLASELSNTVCETWFRVSNESSRQISVNVVSKSCTCVNLLVDEKAITVGDSFALSIGERKTIQLVGRVNPVASVQRFRANLVAIDDSTVNLQGSQTVYADLECAPDLLAVAMRRNGEAVVERSVEVVHNFRSETRQSVPPTVAAPEGVMVVSISPQRGPEELEPGLWRETWNVNLKLKPAAIADRLATVRFTFGKSEICVPIKITQAFGITVPERVAFGVVDVGAQRKRRLVMHSTDGVPFKVVKAVADSREVGVSATASSETRYWIDLEFHPVEPGERRARVSIETTHPDSPRLAIETIGRAL